MTAANSAGEGRSANAIGAASADRHAHICECCGLIFWHDRDRNLPEKAQRDRHRCPSCFAGPYFVAYETQRDAMEVRRLISAHF